MKCSLWNHTPSLSQVILFTCLIQTTKKKSSTFSSGVPHIHLFPSSLLSQLSVTFFLPRESKMPKTFSYHSFQSFMPIIFFQDWSSFEDVWQGVRQACCPNYVVTHTPLSPLPCFSLVPCCPFLQSLSSPLSVSLLIN